MVTFKPVELLTQAIAELVQNGLSCMQNVKGLSLHPKLNQIALVAPENTQTSFNFFESYIGSFEATINSDFIHICL